MSYKGWLVHPQAIGQKTLIYKDKKGSPLIGSGATAATLAA